MVLQVTLGFSITDVPYLGLIHGANALAVVVAAVGRGAARAARRARPDGTRAAEEATTDAVAA